MSSLDQPERSITYVSAVSIVDIRGLIVKYQYGYSLLFHFVMNRASREIKVIKIKDRVKHYQGTQTLFMLVD
jgi:hypothetical protein